MQGTDMNTSNTNSPPSNQDEPKTNLKGEGKEPEKDMVLTHKEAEAASPDDYAVCGEEDPGEALEGLVTHDRDD